MPTTRPPLPEFTIRPLDRPGDLGWVLITHGMTMANEFGGDRAYEGLVARVIADYASGTPESGERAWIAEQDGERVGCVFHLRGAARGTSLLKLLLVTPDARRQGIGHALVRTCVDYARAQGTTRVDVWAADIFAAAGRVFESAGFTVTFQEAEVAFGRNVTGQQWTKIIASELSTAD